MRSALAIPCRPARGFAVACRSVAVEKCLAAWDFPAARGTGPRSPCSSSDSRCQAPALAQSSDELRLAGSRAVVVWKASAQERRALQPALLSRSSARASAPLDSCSAGVAGRVQRPSPCPAPVAWLPESVLRPKAAGRGAGQRPARGRAHGSWGGPTPRAEPSAGAATGSAGGGQTETSCAPSKQKSSHGFSAGWGGLWRIRFPSGCVGAGFPLACDDQTPLRCPGSGPVCLPPKKCCLFLLTKLLNKVKREGLGKRRQCSWTQKNPNDPEKVQKMATPRYFLVAVFGVGQTLKTKESTWLVGLGRKAAGACSQSDSV